jgi:hypothetical protein
MQGESPTEGKQHVGEKALDDTELEQIEINFYRDLFGDYEVRRLLETARIQRSVLKTLFNLLTHESSTAFRCNALAALKRLVAMGDTP